MWFKTVLFEREDDDNAMEEGFTGLRKFGKLNPSFTARMVPDEQKH